MKRITHTGALSLLALLGVGVCGRTLGAQDSPIELGRKELPKSAVCVVCEANGEGHAEEKPAAGVRYKGKSYYFCNAKEVAEFKKDPESFMPPVLPRTAPELKLKTLDGSAATLADYRGKVVLVDWWATWCKPCIAAMPDVEKLHVKYAPKGFMALGVSIDEDGIRKVKPFLDKRKFTYPIVLDAAGQWKSWSIRAIPAMFLVDKDGRIVRQWTGKVDRNEIEKAVAGLLKWNRLSSYLRGRVSRE
jgi:peroxiredoxin/YHS domain-containing protein